MNFVPEMQAMAITNAELDKLVSFSKSDLPLATATLGKEYYYASLPLCVIDSVFSIGVRYEGVRKTIARFCAYYSLKTFRETPMLPPEEEQQPTSYFLKLFASKSSEQLATEVYRNRQRTSTKNGILKAEAVIRFLEVLKQYGAEYFQDVPKLYNNAGFGEAIRQIPGQRSGISLQYFYMLAGSDNYIKPDRMVLRFLENVTGRNFTTADAQTVLSAVAENLKAEGYQVSPRLLDHVIWNYQRIPK